MPMPGKLLQGNTRAPFLRADLALRFPLSARRSFVRSENRHVSLLLMLSRGVKQTPLLLNVQASNAAQREAGLSSVNAPKAAKVARTAKHGP